jgi:hypothetical protein
MSLRWAKIFSRTVSSCFILRPVISVSDGKGQNISSRPRHHGPFGSAGSHLPLIHFIFVLSSFFSRENIPTHHHHFWNKIKRRGPSFIPTSRLFRRFCALSATLHFVLVGNASMIYTVSNQWRVPLTLTPQFLLHF